ncbi:MAG: 1-acyl-sn-glycerol-3-phosphate acyltransferase [Candidatus Eremiobacteraeota bacterium]|nr:1-acyl-sn-glycerol-3-phosphate acyltransferase [Candidatus Eremiobacteraeota bacterium]
MLLASLVAAFLAWLARLISGANALWLDCQPVPRQRIYFGNHTSHMDFVVLWSVLPDDVRAVTRPVAAGEYWTTSKLRNFVAAEVFRAVLVDRNSTTAEERRAQMERMLEGMGTDQSLIIFPEGTRGEGDEVQPFKSGLYHLAKAKPNVELVPVYLENLNRVLPKGEYLPVPLLSRVYFGPPMQLEQGEGKEAFLERARQAMIGLAQ